MQCSAVKEHGLTRVDVSRKKEQSKLVEGGRGLEDRRRRSDTFIKTIFSFWTEMHSKCNVKHNLATVVLPIRGQCIEEGSNVPQTEAASLRTLNR